MTKQTAWERKESRRLIGWTEAVQAAKIFCEHPEIKAVLAFGSVARDGEGEDLDIILVCDEAVSYEFLFYVASVLDEEQDDFYTRASDIRRSIAVMSLSEEGELDEISYRVEPFVSIYDMDIFIFPPDWRERLDELQGAMPHSDPNFMYNIARDARALWVKQQ
ncbi:MAG: hypothetical protein AAB972_04630 [Patescibacteria group bacterium]